MAVYARPDGRAARWQDISCPDSCRGNLQLSPEVLRAVGIDNILGVVTPAKLLTVRTLRIETGDEMLDAEFASKRYMKVLQGYRTTRVLPVTVD